VLVGIGGSLIYPAPDQGARRLGPQVLRPLGAAPRLLAPWQVFSRESPVSRVSTVHYLSLGRGLLPLLREARATPLRRARATHRPHGRVQSPSARRPRSFRLHQPVDFSLAIFVGQVAAAFAAGNQVIAKPAEQTPKVAARAVKLLHEAGIPEDAVVLVPGRGEIGGAALVADFGTAGVALTGSAATARAINRTLLYAMAPSFPSSPKPAASTRCSWTRARSPSRS